MFQKTHSTTNSFCRKMKTAHLEFKKKRHLCFSKKLLKLTMPRCLKQWVPQKNSFLTARQEPVVSTSRAGCTVLRLSITSGLGKPRGNADTRPQSEGGSAQKPWAPRCYPNPFRCLPNGAKPSHSPLQPLNLCSISDFDQQGQTSVSSTKMKGKRQTQLQYSTFCSKGSVPES